MVKQKKILVTFDCELFLGKRSGSVANCMLLPTSKILNLLAKHQATAIFFVDMLYLCRLKKVAEKFSEAKNDFDLTERLLIEMAEQGHYIFNHLHPHWLDAIYDEQKNEWLLDNASKYTFESLSEIERESVFERTMNLLNEILNKASKNFTADGYRAGGLYIQPFTSFKNYFEKHGIKNDFSVLINAIGESDASADSFNFSGIAKNIYRFNNEVATEEENGAFTEYAMRFVEIPIVYRLLNSLFYRLFSKNKKHQRHGNGISTSNRIYSSTKKRFSSTETFAVEMLNEIKLPLYLKEVEQNNYLHLLSHPKLVSDYNLQVFDKLLGKLATMKDVEFDFKKFDFKKE
jgi:peptidoglycan/xylan/chitin deacetylase (PgdA/CDA1 family)